MSKIMKIIGGTLGILLLICAIPVGACYACFYDGNQYGFEGDKDVEMKPYLTSKFMHALDHTEENRKISLSLDQKDLNQLLYSALGSMPEQAQNSITGLKVEIKEDRYVFYVSGKVPAFKSTIRLETILEEVKDTDPAKSYFRFRIEKGSVGRIGNATDIALTIMEHTMKDEDLNQSFASAGVHIQSDLANKCFYYYKSDMLSDMKTFSSSSEDDSLNLVQAFLSTAIKNNLISLDFYGNNALTCDFDLEPLSVNPTYLQNSKKLGNDIDFYRNQVVTLMNSQVVDYQDNKAVNMMMAYLLQGYSHCSDETKEYVQDKDLTSIGISDYRTYTGAKQGTERNITETIKSQLEANVPSLLLNPSIRIASVTEDDVGAAILQSGVFGYSYLLTEKKEDNTIACNYLVLDNCYCDIQDDTMSLVVGMNVNGCETSLIVDTKASKMVNMKIDFTIQNLYFGNVEIEGELKDYLYTVLKTALAKTDWMNFDSTKAIFTMDISKAVTGSSVHSLINSELIQATLHGTDLASVGTIDFTINPLSL